MPMVTVSISPEQAAKMREAVDCGEYASGSEVVRAALRLWFDTNSATRRARRAPSETGEHMNVADLYAAHALKKHG
ncbi:MULTISPECIES: ribbon-helix-helix domain-containing protein [unclassified Rhizobium]|uniref:ribbon-helix-helix domain-containing protein n=1 Tax=unclassified Rhizobium TaxID=2613769 RepID=UPI00177DB69A|nr:MULTISPECIES: type II toxin-antitoxin system ParD family antitoxin [unclassified Rhizobium]MBD8685673.1 type II toxin-antitoxin system ParD family antitoxin [Rhizobium sp. CFBP 13644]MBD8690654.1 type II toxin-antitoxin system ParD family antitoxin [Rhizobium sp. CFBP 13717]